MRFQKIGMRLKNVRSKKRAFGCEQGLRQRLHVLCGHPDNVDLFVAGLVEDPWYDSLLGQTFTRLNVKQFEKFRDGDR